MMKKSVFMSAFASVIATSLVVGAVTYESVRMEEPKNIDFSAFKNAAANIQFLTQKAEIKPLEVQPDHTKIIVRLIENEIRGKIKATRYGVLPKKIKTPEIKSIAKNWNDIRPELRAVDFKVNKALVSAVGTNEVQTEFEINNNELINLYGYEVDTFEYETFSNTVIADVLEAPAEVMQQDAVKVAQASTTSNVAEEIIPDSEKVNPVNDDLVMFDYSAGENIKEAEIAPTFKKVFDSPISQSVKNAIAREVGRSPKLAMNTQAKSIAPTIVDTKNNNQATPDVDLEKIMADEDTVMFDYSKPKAATNALSAKEETQKAIAGFTNLAPDTTTQSNFTIQVTGINLSTRKSLKISEFDYIPDYDRAERIGSSEGEVKLGYSLAGDVTTQTGIIERRGLITTRVELNLLNEGMNIPMLSEAGIQRFLKNKQADVVGNLLMVAVDESITDIEIDSDYSYKLYFSEKFKMLESRVGASYILFLGVKTGNIVTRYLLDNKESAQKIVYVGDGEMYYEDPDFVNTQRELYTFTTRSLLGKKVKELNIDGSDVSFYGTKINAKKKALNAYEIKVPELVYNSRKYLEFKHLGTSLFVGTQNTKEIEIPGNDFIGRVMQANDLSSLGERCLVQVNLTKDLRDLKVSGKNMNGEMFVEPSFLDNDGNFSRDNLELSEKVFITGDMEGIFNVRLDYSDGTTDFLKTFCSEGSYLVEQL